MGRASGRFVLLLFKTWENTGMLGLVVGECAGLLMLLGEIGFVCFSCFLRLLICAVVAVERVIFEPSAVSALLAGVAAVGVFCSI